MTTMLTCAFATASLSVLARLLYAAARGRRMPRAADYAGAASDMMLVLATWFLILAFLRGGG